MWFHKKALYTNFVESIGRDNMSGIIEKSFDLAFSAHEGQFRSGASGDRGERIPYIVHPVGAALMAHDFFNKIDNTGMVYEDIIAATLLHDTVEDTELTLLEIESKISRSVGALVEVLTKPEIVGNMSSGERAVAFTDKIIKHGNSAMYIKICDFFHNMSRPQSTPDYIMEKLIFKGQNHYSRFFYITEAFEEMKAHFDSQIENCKQGLREESKEKKVKSLEEAVVETIALFEEKEVELHDINHSIKKVTSANYMNFLSLKDIEKIFVQENSGEKRDWEGEIREGKIQGKVIFDGQTHDMLYCFKSDLTRKEDKYFVVGLDRDKKPDWVNYNMVKLFILSITERMKFRISEKNKGILLIAAKLDMNLDADDIDIILRKDIKLFSFRKFLDVAYFIFNKIYNNIFFHFIEKDENTIVLEKRRKEPSSLLKKMVRLDVNKFSKIDDVVAFRVIVLNKKSVKNVIEKIKESLLKNGYVSDESKLEKSIREVQSYDGYHGTHINFFLDTIGIEIQIQTAQQHAWSEISHNTVYKKEKDRKKKKILKKVSQIGEDIDNLMDQI